MQFHSGSTLKLSDIALGSVRFGGSHRRTALPLELQKYENKNMNDNPNDLLSINANDEVFFLREGSSHYGGKMEQPLGSEAVVEFDHAKVLRGVEITLGPAPVAYVN
jgi:hypothetical protein